MIYILPLPFGRRDAPVLISGKHNLLERYNGVHDSYDSSKIPKTRPTGSWRFWGELVPNSWLCSLIVAGKVTQKQKPTSRAKNGVLFSSAATHVPRFYKTGVHNWAPFVGWIDTIIWYTWYTPLQLDSLGWIRCRKYQSVHHFGTRHRLSSNLEVHGSFGFQRRFVYSTPNPPHDPVLGRICAGVLPTTQVCGWSCMVQLQRCILQAHLYISFYINLSMYPGFCCVCNVSEFRHGISRHHEHQAELWIELLRYWVEDSGGICEGPYWATVHHSTKRRTISLNSSCSLPCHAGLPSWCCSKGASAEPAEPRLHGTQRCCRWATRPWDILGCRICRLHHGLATHTLHTLHTTHTAGRAGSSDSGHSGCQGARWNEAEEGWSVRQGQFVFVGSLLVVSKFKNSLL